jgi:hypothetical protein
MRISVTGSMVVKIRPFDSFIVVKVRVVLSSEFPNKESDDTKDGDAACDG